MTLATSHVSAPRPNSSRRRSTARSSSGMARFKKGCSARLGDTAFDPHPEGRRLGGGAARQGHHPRLGRRVVRLARLGPPPEHRGVVDDDAALLRQHPGQSGTGAAESPGQRDVEHGRPLLVGHLHQRHGPAEAGVVHRHVDAAEARRRTVIEGAHLRLVAHVAGQRVHPLGAVGTRLGRQLLGRLGQAPLVGIGDHDRRPLFQAAPGRGGPDPRPGGRGHDDHLPLQQPVPARGRRWGGGSKGASRLVLTPPLSAPAGGRAPAHR